MISVILLFAFTACAPAAPPLEDRTWVLQSYGQPGNLKNIISGTEITAQFLSAENRLAGSGGCNSCFGTYTISGGKITVSDIGATKKFCGSPAGVMDQEQTYFNILGKAQSYEVQEDTLTIKSSAGQEMLFRRK